MRSRRTEKTAIVERQEGDQEAPHSPQRSFATRSNLFPPLKGVAFRYGLPHLLLILWLH